MATKRKAPVRGLEGVVAAETGISYVNGDHGKLFYRGYDLDRIAGRVSFEELVHLLWFGEFPTAEELDDFQGVLAAEMRLPTQVLEMMKLVPPSANPMATSRLDLYPNERTPIAEATRKPMTSSTRSEFYPNSSL